MTDEIKVGSRVRHESYGGGLVLDSKKFVKFDQFVSVSVVADKDLTLIPDTDRINEIRARLEAATSGPWEEDGPVVRSVQTGEDVTGLCESENRDFIAHAPDDIAYLLARVECGDALREAVRRFLYVNSDNPPLGYANLDNATDAYDAEPTGKPEKPVVYCGNCRKRGIERRVDFNWYEEKKEWLGGTWHLDNSYESCSLNDEPFCGFAEPTKIAIEGAEGKK
jgi:hypothetical protein